jgi:N-acetylneuraminic acid mutarotase
MCVGNDVCLDGECRAPDLLCSAEHPDGLCVNGSACFAGACLDVGAGCSAQNSTGVCPVGQVCHGGACVDLDGAALCDDHDACTLDYFDHRRNRCAHEPQDVPCSDGNDCTTDTCQAGVCVSEHVAGCVEPPVLDPYVTPTNQVQLHLSGTKPAGSAVEINGDVAVAESPDARWSVTVNLVPGENVYRVRTLARDGESAFVEVRVVYDITPPTTSVTPGGGVFLDGVTVTAATDEPATVYYTTDGSTPDETSASFTSARAFRVFDDTTLRFRARDEAGNWEADVRTADFEITSHGNRWHDGTALPGGLVHPAVTAGNAAIYVAGGSDGLADQAGAYAYRYDEDAWVNLPALPSPRSEASAVWFGGAIYLFGGENDGAPLNGVLRLDPAADHAWVARRVMPSTRFGLVAVASGNNIYVFGGQTNGGSVLSTLEVYSPANDTWSNQVAQMPRARYGFAAVENGGNIYLIGGEDEQGTPIAVVDVYNVAQNRWTQVAPLPTPRAFLTATVNYNAGRVTGGPTGIVVAGGRVAGGAPTAVVEEYLIDRDEWRARTPLPRPRYSAGGVAVEGAGELDTRDVQGWIVGGQVGVPGGVVADQVTPSLLYYTQSFDHLRRLRDLPAGRFMHAAAALDDRIYLFGGREFQETTHGWAFDPETETFTPIADLPGAQNGLSAVTLNGEVWAIGGANAFGTAIATVRSYDPATNAWTDHRPMLTGRRDPAAVVLNGQVVVIGGDNGGAVQAVEIYDPVADRWSNGPLLPVARTGAVAVVWHGSIYVAGGKDADGHVQSSVLRLAGNQWQPVYDGIPVTYATAALINGRLNVFAGRENGALSNRHWNLDLANPRLEYTLTPETRLLAPYDYQAAATLNGDVYLFGGNANADPGPSGLTTVEKFAGRCLNGVQDRYEGQDGQNYPDVGGGCGRIDPTVAITPGHGYGHHGGCNSWNECNDAQGCANLACAHFGYGPAVSFRQVNCSNGGVTCDIFQDNLSIDPGWHSRADCDLPLATDVVCTRPQ